MPIKNILFIVLFILLGLAGFYLIFTSGYLDADPFNVVLALIVGVIIVYFYQPGFARKNRTETC